MTNRRNKLIGIGLGVAAAAVAIAAGATAINAASTGTSHRLLSSDDVARQLARVPGVAATPGPSKPATSTPATPAPGVTPLPGNTAPAGGSQIFRSAGGTVVVTCAGNTTTLQRWTPNSGFRADDNAVSPAHSVRVQFESDTADDVTVTVTCTNGVASATAANQPDDHGGNNNGGTPTPGPTDDHGGRNGGGGTDDPSGHH
ncbi:MAG TPA: hypothetical protein VKB69_12120 [Micromonosporaceae bacterium]|nr:hypothetical protein [Micromonosporaceae bacterium]